MTKPSHEKPGKASRKGGSERLTLARRVVDPSNPSIKYLDSLRTPDEDQHIEQPLLATVRKLLQDNRKLFLSLPIPECKGISVTLSTFFRTLVQELVHKGRLPDEVDKWQLAVITAVELLLASPDESGRSVLYSSGEVDRETIQTNINETKNPFLIRIRNIFASLELPEEQWKSFLRPKLKSGEKREQVIIESPERLIMPYIFKQVEQIHQVTALERVFLYLILLDPAFEDFSVEFVFRDINLKLRIREILAGMVNYGFALTYYNKEVSKINPDVIHQLCRHALHSVIGRAFRTRKKRTVPEGIENAIKERIAFIVKSDLARLDDLRPLPGNWRFPKKAMERILNNLGRAHDSNDYPLQGYLAIRRRERYKEMKPDSV